MKINYSELYIRNILEKVNTISVIGASPTKTRDSYKVMEALIQNGYEISASGSYDTHNVMIREYNLQLDTPGQGIATIKVREVE